MENLKRFYFYFLGALTGLANGLFGSGGGSISVPLLEKGGLESHKAHATSIAITLPLSIISAILYFKKGHFDLSEALKYIPGGLAGAIAGGLLLKKIPDKALRQIFGAILIISGARLLLT
ncbi:MAG: sulfite exporter TauE/SafE family protein [Oscillospiraceae bacterium]